MIPMIIKLGVKYLWIWDLNMGLLWFSSFLKILGFENKLVLGKVGEKRNWKFWSMKINKIEKINVFI